MIDTNKTSASLGVTAMIFATKTSAYVRSTPKRRSRRPAIEPLEGRLLLATYYVGITNAADDASHGTLAAPFATLQYAINAAETSGGTAAGDTIYIRSGTYRQTAWLTRTTQGGSSATQKLIIAAYPGDAMPVFKGSNLVNTSTGFSWTRVEAGKGGSGGAIYQMSGWTAPSDPVNGGNSSSDARQLFINDARYLRVGEIPQQQLNAESQYGQDLMTPIWADGYVNNMYESMARISNSFYYAGGSLYVHYATDVTAAQFSAQTIEVAVRGMIFFMDHTKVKFVDIRGLAFEQDNAISMYGPYPWAVSFDEGGTFSGNVVRNNSFVGVNLQSARSTSGAQTLLEYNTIESNGVVGVGGTGQNVTFRYNTIRNNNSLITDNAISGDDFMFYNPQWVAGGIKLMPDAAPTIEYNEISNNGGPAVWIDTSDSGVPMLIRNNNMHHNYSGGGTIMIEVSKNALIYNNLIVNNSNANGGLYLSNAADNRFYNNTIANHTPSSGNAAITIYYNPTRSVPTLNNTIRNNIVANTRNASSQDVKYWLQGDPTPGGGANNNTIDYNVYYNSAAAGGRGNLVLNNTPGSGGTTSLTTWKTYTNTYDPQTFDANSYAADPKFVSATDFHTLSNGPGVNHGTDLSGVVDIDYAGVLRPQGGAYDIGAYEYFVPDAVVPTITSVRVNDGSPQRSMVNDVTVVFSEPVNAAAGLSILRSNSALSGQMAYYSMNQGSGSTLTDDSGNGNTGALVNAPAWATGRPGDGVGLRFDGASSYVDVPDNSTIEPANAITVAGWFNHNSAGGNGDAGIIKSFAYRLAAVEADAAQSHWKFLLWDAAGAFSVTTTDAYSNDTWHAVVGTYDGATVRIYVDGALAVSAPWAGHTLRNSPDNLRIGRGNADGYYAGSIDDVRILSRAMTDTEVAAYSLAVTSTPSADKQTWKLTFSGSSVLGGSLPDGAYTLLASASRIKDMAGNPLAADYRYRFHRLFGDTDGDRDVDQKDLAVFKQSLNRPAYVWWLDFTGDTKINNSDYLQLRSRLVKPLL